MKTYIIESYKTKNKYKVDSDCMDNAIKRVNKEENQKSFGNCTAQGFMEQFHKENYIILN